MAHIREAGPADRDAVVRMAVRFALETAYGAFLVVSPEMVGGLFDQVLEHEIGAILLAEVDGQPVGMLAIVDVPHPYTGQRFASELCWWVDPEHRKGRAGPQLLVAAQEWATSRKLNMIQMTAPAGSAVGTFYERLGYLPVETTYRKGL